jgi:hypothetical protein
MDDLNIDLYLNIYRYLSTRDVITMTAVSICNRSLILDSTKLWILRRGNTKDLTYGEPTVSDFIVDEILSKDELPAISAWCYALRHCLTFHVTCIIMCRGDHRYLRMPFKQNDRLDVIMTPHEFALTMKYMGSEHLLSDIRHHIKVHSMMFTREEIEMIAGSPETRLSEYPGQAPSAVMSGSIECCRKFFIRAMSRAKKEENRSVALSLLSIGTDTSFDMFTQINPLSYLTLASITKMTQPHQYDLFEAFAAGKKDGSITRAIIDEINSDNPDTEGLKVLLRLHRGRWEPFAYLCIRRNKSDILSIILEENHVDKDDDLIVRYQDEHQSQHFKLTLIYRRKSTVRHSCHRKAVRLYHIGYRVISSTI